jgi:hypothetical protein
MHIAKIIFGAVIPILVGITAIILGAVNTSQAKDCMNQNLSSNCKGCNANTPSTWKNCQSFAKKLLPTDVIPLHPFPQPFNPVNPIYPKNYIERERQVESAQNLGKFQGRNKMLIIVGIILLVQGLGYTVSFMLTRKVKSRKK